MDFQKLSQRNLSLALGISDRTLRTWAERGLPRNSDKSYSLPLVIEWLLNEKKEDETTREASTEAEGTWLELYRKERYFLTRMQREREEGRTWDRDEISLQWTARMVAVSSGLDQFEYRLPPLLEGLSQDGMRPIIAGVVRKLKDNYCRTGRFCIPEAEEVEP